MVPLHKKGNKMKMRKVIFAVATSLAFLASAGEMYTSIGQANASFATNSVTGKKVAYDYVAGKVKVSDGRNTGWELTILRNMANALGRATDFDEICGQILSSPAEGARFAGIMALTQSPSLWTKDPKRVGELLGPAIRNEVALATGHRLEAEKALADFLAMRMKDIDGGIAILDAAIGRNGSDANALSQLRLKKLGFLVSARRDDELEREAKAVLAISNCPASGLSSATYALADLKSRQQKPDEAGRLLLALVERCGNQVPAGIAQKLVELKVSEACLESAVDALRQSLATMPLNDVGAFRDAVARVQPEVVCILNHLGRSDEALAECRAFVFCAAEKDYQSAVMATASTLKKADGNLGRAVAFMEFQKKGVVPGGRNVVMGAPKLSDRVRSEALKALAEEKSASWNRSLAVSVRLLWLDEPVLAVKAALDAFALAPFDANALQQCANAAMRPVLVATRNPEAVNGIVEYLTYGANGRDGQPGTKDDLSSPLAQVGPHLAVGKKE